MLAFAAVSLALAASARAAPVAASLATVEASLSAPNTTQTDAVVYYYQNGNAGACGLYSEDSDLVAGLPTEFYSELGAVSAYCGSYIVIKSDANNETVTARVADASATNKTLSVSIATWEALNGTATHLDTVQWRFANETETAAAIKALESSSSSAVASPVAEKTSSSSAAPAPSSSAAPSSTQAPTTTQAPQTTTQAPQTTTQAPQTTTRAPQSSSDTYDYASASSASAASAASAASKASADAAWASSSSSSAAAAASSASKASADAAWASSSSAAAAAWTPSTTTEQAQATAKSYSSSASSGSYSGTATYFYQGGNPGNCGIVHSDSDYIVALTTSMYASGSHCGQTVSICSNDSGKCTSATVADSCPSCTSSGDLDLSVAAFTALADTSAGVTSITWSFA